MIPRFRRLSPVITAIVSIWLAFLFSNVSRDCCGQTGALQIGCQSCNQCGPESSLRRCAPGYASIYYGQQSVQALPVDCQPQDPNVANTPWPSVQPLAKSPSVLSQVRPGCEYMNSQQPTQALNYSMYPSVVLSENSGSASNGCYSGPQHAGQRSLGNSLMGQPSSYFAGPCSPAGSLSNFGCASSQFTGGIDALVLRVHYDQNVAMIIDPVPGNRLVPFEYAYGFSPRVWLGIQKASGINFKTTYWYFESTADRETATAVAGSTPIYLFVYGAGDNLTRNAYADLGETLSSIHSTRLQALDFEMGDTINIACWGLQPSAGVRLATIDQYLRGDVYNALGGLEETVTNELSLRAAGPTVGLRVSRGYGCSPFGMYTTARGSLLFSSSDQQIYEMKNAGVDQIRDRAQQTEILSVFELGLGLQHARCWSSGLRTVAGVGYELQSWADVGGPVDSTSTLGLDGLSARLSCLY